MKRAKPEAVYIRQEHKGWLHSMAVKWLKDRAYDEAEGGLGLFADTRYCNDLTKLLQRVENVALKRQTRSYSKGRR